MILEFGMACAGWLLFWPITRLIPRRRALAVFYGRDGGRYIDNCKHLFATATRYAEGRFEAVYLTTDRADRDQLRALGARAEVSSSLCGTWAWLRAGTIVVDNVDWLLGTRFASSRGARVVQLWHGIPLKHVQFARIGHRRSRRSAWERLLFNAYLRVVGRSAPTQWFLSTSRYVTERAFSSSFRYAQVAHTGYPRNDVLFRPGSALAEFGVDTEVSASVTRHRKGGRSRLVGMYAPTFRESMQDPFADDSVDLAKLSAAASRLNILLLVKLHPWVNGRVRTMELPGILFVRPESDAYPLLRDVDFLITDYSSIFFDFLLLDRPVIFFPYDLAHYLENERAMYFDYSEMAPGPKPETTNGLIEELQQLVAGTDTWREDRARVRRLVFDSQDGHAAERLLNLLFPRERHTVSSY